MENSARSAIDIMDREMIFKLLAQLQPDSIARFGIMSAQHMIEHLALAVRYGNGREPQELQYRQEKADKIKFYVINTDNEIQAGFKSPTLPLDDLLPLKHLDLGSAIENLRLELKLFDEYFKANPESRPVNPTMGVLTHEEWIIFQNKHITHHFKQFGLL